MTGAMTDIVEGLVKRLHSVREQLIRMIDGASFVRDGHVRVTDPVYLLECLAEAASALEALVVERDEARAQRDAYRDERDNLTTIVSSGIDDVAGADLDDLEARALAAEANLQIAREALAPASDAMYAAINHLEEWPGNDDMSQHDKAQRIAAQVVRVADDISTALAKIGSKP